MPIIDNKKNIRSFGRINGRGKVKTDALEKVEFLITEDYKIDKNNVNHLEIGFGYGESLLARAITNPAINYIGCETYVKGVLNLASNLAANNVKNVKIFNGDARILLEKFDNQSIDMIFILFPDPWPKKKQNKRRIISDDFLILLQNKLKNDGKLFFATDIDSYVEWTLEKLQNNGHFSGYCTSTPPNWWVKTKYQEKAIKEGRSSKFLEYKLI